MRTAAYTLDDGGLDDRVPFLARLEQEDRTALLSLGRELNFAPRVALLHQSEPSSHVLFLVQGWTKVTASAANGYEALLALRGPGDIVGESAALTGRPRSATVTALEAGARGGGGARTLQGLPGPFPRCFVRPARASPRTAPGPRTAAAWSSRR